jgi:hypothetical protein
LQIHIRYGLLEIVTVMEKVMDQIFNESGIAQDAYTKMADKNHFRNIKHPPHMHIYCSVVFVDPGDLESKDPEARRNKAWEAGQYVVQIPPEAVGNLSIHHIHNAFKSLREQAVAVIRRCGGLRGGQ